MSLGWKKDSAKENVRKMESSYIKAPVLKALFNKQGRTYEDPWRKRFPPKTVFVHFVSFKLDS